MENLKRRLLNYKTVEEFLVDLKKEFGGGDNKIVKVAELKKVKQEGKIMKKLVQEFRRVARGSGYKRRPLVKEFKRGMTRVIRRKLIKTERPLKSIKQWYKRAVNLNRHWRKNKREEKRLRKRREIGAPT